MNIASTQYTLKHKSFEIYVSGCDGSCEGCHNHELWDYNLGDTYQQCIYDMIEKIKEFDNMIENIWVMGGEPLLQNHTELINMLCDLRTTDKKIWLWTRFELEDIPDSISELCDFIKTGKYDENLITDDNIQYGIKLATSNQQIHRIGEIQNGKM